MDAGDGAVQAMFDLQVLVGGDEDVVASDLELHTEAGEGDGRDLVIGGAGALDQQRRARHGRQGDERADLEIVGADVEAGARQGGLALDDQGVGANALDGGPHGHQQPADILDVRL